MLSRSTTLRSTISLRQLSSSARTMAPAVPITSSPPTWGVWRSDPAHSIPLDSKTLVNQPALPRLPVPQLQVTLDKVLESCKALAKDDKEWDELRRKVEEFGRKGGVGEVVQGRLEARREEPGMRNWIAEWWDHDAYMSYRDSVVVNVSYYYGFERLPQAAPSSTSPSSSDPAYVAASIVATALEFRRLVAKGLLEPELAGKEGELCMESYKWAFNACRVPSSPSDYAVKIAEDSPEGQSMVVVHRNHFWEVALRDASGREFGVEELRRAFQSIYDRDSAPAPGVGILTGVNRDHWAEAHIHLLTSPTNSATLTAIRNSAFVLALDDATPDPSLAPIAGNPTSLTSEGIKEFSERIWKAGGKSSGAGEAANRWWDKPLQWIIFANGEAGFIGEHSCMDGTPTARMNDFISKRLLTNKPTAIGASDPAPSATPAISELAFELDGKALGMIESATKEFADHVGQFDVFYLKYGRYGKDGIKAMKTSPDGWTQMIFQLAYYMTHGHPCGTYEAAQVRKFQLGRTETVRICTPETVAWTKAMLDSGSNDSERKALFAKAVGVHGKDMKNASSGMGIDRHLFGLRKLVKEGENAELLKDPLLARSGTWNMSTSQIYIRHAPAYGWGPVAEEGYGLPYMIHPECLQFTVTCNSSRMDGQKFLDNIGKSADLLMDMMEGQSAKL